MKLAFCIRGHIRDGLFTSSLRQFISLCEADGHSIDIYCHTWSESEAKSSYKILDRSDIFQVKEGLLRSYLKGCNVSKVIIENDLKVKIHGTKTGVVCKSMCPIIAWKRMWAGQASVINQAYTTGIKYDLIVNMRYDYFTTPICYTPQKHLCRLIAKKPSFAFKYPDYSQSIIGVDNFYIGTPENMHKIVNDFHLNLDSIIAQYHNIINQEELVYRHACNVGVL
jgi:hypothetical protein